MNTKLAKNIYEMVATETNPRRPVAGITFPQNVADGDSTKTHVVDVIVHLT
jgi:hypothetical protein